jgi:DNA-binding IclR family transcriptional regulator
MVSILNFFADHPGQSFTLTDLIRALKLGRATCHALLAGLVEERYLYRTYDKSYTLGPKLLEIGRIAAEHSSPLQAAQPEMRALADELEAICSVFLRERDEVVVRATAASVSQLGASVSAGTRLPLRAPFAAVFYAWSSPEASNAWLDWLSPPPTPEHRDEMIRGMAFARDHGYCFGVRNFDVPIVQDEDVGQLFRSGRARYPHFVASALEPHQDYALGFVLAPVFDSKGEVAFVLGLTAFTGGFSGAKVEQMGRRLREASDRLTAFLGGSPR